MFRKVLVANRGEIATRIIKTCRSLGVRTVAVYSDADADALHVGLADEARRLGPPAPSQSYLSITRLVEVALETGSDAVHPGYGFLAENHAFAEACERRGLAFVGPSSETLTTTGNKLAAKGVARKQGVPVVPGSTGTLRDVGEAVRVARDIGYPVLIKAAFGGGGRGIREVGDSEQLKEDFRRAEREAALAFGRRGLYIEKLVRPARHLEVQILSDGTGKVVHLGERECSIQRRHQKLVEFTPSPILDGHSRRRLTDFAIAVARGVHYKNAGTIEFLRTDDGQLYFNEVNARIQVEHPITEATTGIDIVREQLLIASEGRVSFHDVRFSGAAIECRINAEDPEANFAPSTGVVEGLRIPTGPGIRVDTALYDGCQVREYYDSLVAKLVAWGSDLQEARERILNALPEFQIRGIRTTIPFHRELIGMPELRGWNLRTDLIENGDILQRIARARETRRLRTVQDGVVVAAAMIAAGVHEIREIPVEAGRQARAFDQEGEPEGRFYDAS